MRKLIKVMSKHGFDAYTFEDQVEILIGADGIVRLHSHFGNLSEMLLSPSQCRDALFEERDLWH